jgi:hypothetical protein
MRAGDGWIDAVAGTKKDSRQRHRRHRAVRLQCQRCRFALSSRYPVRLTTLPIGTCGNRAAAGRPHLARRDPLSRFPRRRFPSWPPRQPVGCRDGRGAGSGGRAVGRAGAAQVRRGLRGDRQRHVPDGHPQRRVRTAAGERGRRAGSATGDDPHRRTRGRLLPARGARPHGRRVRGGSRAGARRDRVEPHRPTACRARRGAGRSANPAGGGRPGAVAATERRTVRSTVPRRRQRPGLDPDRGQRRALRRRRAGPARRPPRPRRCAGRLGCRCVRGVHPQARTALRRRARTRGARTLRSIRASSNPAARAAPSTVAPCPIRCSARSRRSSCW